MSPRTLIAVLALTVLAGAAIAHSGVTNAAVFARMENMKQTAEALEVLGNMARGTIPYNAARAAEARNSLIELGAEVPSKFEARETDPRMEARPELWDNWNDFVAKAEASRSAAEALDVSSRDTIGQGLFPIGRACSACHEAYRVEN